MLTINNFSKIESKVISDANWIVSATAEFDDVYRIFLKKVSNRATVIEVVVFREKTETGRYRIGWDNVLTTLHFIESFQTQDKFIELLESGIYIVKK